MPERPILILPKPGPPLPRITKPRNIQTNLRTPSRTELERRFSDKIDAMIESMVTDTPDATSTENILILETAGKVEDFRSAVNRIPGLTWQAEVDIDEIESSVSC